MQVRQDSVAYLDHPAPLAIAHRGGTERHTENSLEAFEDAYRLGIRYMETDVHLTADGVVVAFHDPTLDRVFGYDVEIASLDWASLAELRLPCGAHIPRLEDLLNALPDARFNIDMKSDLVVAPLFELICKMGVIDRVCLASFYDHRIIKAREEFGVRLCTSAGRRSIARQVFRCKGLPFRRSQANIIQVPVRKLGIEIVTPRFIKLAHREGIDVHVWTINEEMEMHRLLDMGVNGIMTDRPRVLRDVIESRGEWV